MSIKVLIVEDEALIAEEIAALLKDNGMETVAFAQNSDEALLLFEKTKPDVILMDIGIQGPVNGIELAGQIKQQSNVPIIFLTSFSDKKTIELAKAVKPHAYLTKPFNQTELPLAIEIAFNNYNDENFLIENYPANVPEHIFLRKNSRYEKVEVNSVLYVEAQGSYCNIITEGHNYLLSYNLSCFQREVKHPHFIRVHRSYIVNLKNIDAFDQQKLFIRDVEIPVSQAYQEDFFKRIKKL